MDPLSVLRDFNTSSKLDVVQQIEGNVQFGDRYSFPVAMPVYKAAFAQAASAYYSLQDVLFYLKNRHLKPQEYVMAANQSGVANISIVDRKVRTGLPWKVLVGERPCCAFSKAVAPPQMFPVYSWRSIFPPPLTVLCSVVFSKFTLRRPS